MKFTPAHPARSALTGGGVTCSTPSWVVGILVQALHGVTSQHYLRRAARTACPSVSHSCICRQRTQTLIVLMISDLCMLVNIARCTLVHRTLSRSPSWCVLACMLSAQVDGASCRFPWHGNLTQQSENGIKCSIAYGPGSRRVGWCQHIAMRFILLESAQCLCGAAR